MCQGTSEAAQRVHRGTPRHPLGVFGLGADFRVRGGGFLEGCSPHRTRRTLRRSCKWTLLARTEGRLGVRGGRPEWPSWLHRGSEGRPGHPLSGSGGGLSWLRVYPMRRAEAAALVTEGGGSDPTPRFSYRDPSGTCNRKVTHPRSLPWPSLHSGCIPWCQGHLGASLQRV